MLKKINKTTLAVNIGFGKNSFAKTAYTKRLDHAYLTNITIVYTSTIFLIIFAERLLTFAK